MLTQERLRELLDYDPETGLFHWRVDRGMNKCAGKQAGYVKRDNKTEGLAYIRIEVDQREHGAHRLAWLWMTGEWPKNEVDHIDRNSTNNRWSNLRDVTRSINKRNCNPHNGRTMKGVYPNGRGYQACVRINKKLVYGGTFDTPEAAFVAANNIRSARGLPLERVREGERSAAS